MYIHYHRWTGDNRLRSERQGAVVVTERNLSFKQSVVCCTVTQEENWYLQLESMSVNEQPKLPIYLFLGWCVWSADLHIIIDFPYHGSTYNGAWCLATETDETLITRPSCEVNVK